jgi:hypothetical protein
MWAGLTFFEMPIILGLLMYLFSFVLDNSAWVVLLALCGGLAHLLLNHPDPFLLALWLPSTLLIVWKHRAGLAQKPGLNVRFRPKSSRKI